MQHVTEWMVAGQYPFKVLPGTAKPITGKKDQSYYRYITEGRYVKEVGKNIIATLWCLAGEKPGQILYEPFGGLGFFALALNKVLNPSHHITGDIDDECFRQLEVSLPEAGAVNMEFRFGDCRSSMETQKCDLAVLEMPLFGRSYFDQDGSWSKPLVQFLKNKPRKVVITDGMRFFYHLNWPRLKNKYWPDLTSDPMSYISHMSVFLYEKTGYSITRCAHHGRCFYYSIEETPPGDFKNKFIENGEPGLRRIS